MKIKFEIIKRAIKESLSSNVKRGHIGAVCFTNNGEILCSAHNIRKEGGAKSKEFTIHAENYLLTRMWKTKAIARYKREKLNIFVLRHKAGEMNFGIAKPCSRCEYLLKKAGVNVYYTDEKGEICRLIYK